MEIKFHSKLTTGNYVTEIEKFVSTLNQLVAKHGINTAVLTFIGTKISFTDGGKLEEMQKKTSMKFASVDVKEYMDEAGPEMVGYVVSNVARYGLLSHRLFDQIKSGGKGAEILIGAS